MRPQCPICQRELVFVALAYPGRMYQAWMCDCMYRDERLMHLFPPGLVALIVRARECDEWSVIVDLSPYLRHA